MKEEKDDDDANEEGRSLCSTGTREMDLFLINEPIWGTEAELLLAGPLDERMDGWSGL